MRKLITFVLMLFLAGGTLSAQSEKSMAKERKAMMKSSRSELQSKASKAARKSAKSYKKQGWLVVPGALPLEKQLDKAYVMQYQYDLETGYPLYITGEGMSTGENYDAAKMQAMELAKQSLAGQIQTEVTALIENTVANKQLTAEEASSVTQSVMASKNLISQSIARTIPVVELYRNKANGNKEVLVRIAYNGDQAKSAVKNAVREDLEKRGDDLHKKLSGLLGW